MAFELRLPDIGEGIAEGEIVRWVVAEGATVREDDLLVEVLTDKANIEIPAPVDGVIARILAQPGQIVKVGEVIALIEAGDAVPAPSAPEKKGASAPEPGKSLSPDDTAAPRAPAGEALATPVVRKLAKDLGVDLSKVPGTGPGGRVIEEDVRAAVGASVPAAEGKPSEERVPFHGKRRMAARKMTLSKSTIPHALLVDEADATNLLAMRGTLREIGQREGVKITLLPFLIQSVVTALRVHPAMNASLDEERGEIVLKRHYDIGIAVDTEDGLVVPVVREAGQKTIVELAREVERLAEGARTGKLPHSDLSGGTFTVTSIGSIGGLFSYPVINLPEAAILGVHKIVRRPVVRGNDIVARDMMYLSLSFDHRLIDGGTATRFMNDLILQIEALGVG
ncbi:MAG TPA: dihydrolipoamide acetyltransferase family protein [Candidatus Limnocylindrales bacterium]|nr:dihydrolipoamide acetyltransferase family protein [Candidatus Limnocylindrales bacterium]